MADTSRGTDEHAGAVLRRLRYSGGRRISQRALATLLGTSRAHIARLELHGFPPLTEEQLDRLRKAGDTIIPPFTRAEIGELRGAMQAVSAAAVEQTDRAVGAMAIRAAQIFSLWQGGPSPLERYPDGSEPHAGLSDASGQVPAGRPAFLTSLSEVADAVKEDIGFLAGRYHPGPAGGPGTEPDLIMTHFAGRNLVEEAEQPERLRDAIIELLRKGATVEYLIAPSAMQAPQGLVSLVPVMIYYLSQGSQRYRVHLIPEFEHRLAYGIYVAGDRGVLVAHGDGGRAVAVRTGGPPDIAALRDLLRPYWKGSRSIIEDLGRRTTDTVTGQATGMSDPMRFDHVLTSVETEDGPRRLAKDGLSILNIPVAVQAWKGRAAELCTARRIPEDLLSILHSQAWELAAHGLDGLPHDVLQAHAHDPGVAAALAEVEDYARGLQQRQKAWGDQLSRHEFWDACPKAALLEFMSTGQLPCDEMPPTCGYKAEREDIEIIITRLITRLRSNRNYHLALIEELPFTKWFFFEVKASHVLAQVFDTRMPDKEAKHPSDDDMLSAHIDCPPIADAFAGWFDEHVLRTATDPPWQDNHRVASWIEKQFQESKRLW
jgi:hypothetical protein